MNSGGMGVGMNGIVKLSDAQTRVITAENVYGQKGKGGMAEPAGPVQAEVTKIGQEPSLSTGPARDLGLRWKVRPCITLPAGKTTTIMDVDGPVVIQHIWITVHNESYRDLIVRMYWDDEKTPSVEVPVGDFFCNGWKKRANVLALPINVNPSGGFNCYFAMPFRKHARITVENRAPKDRDGFFYAITFARAPVGEDDAQFHAQFRRTNPLPYLSDYTILDGVGGHGQYVGTYMAWQQNSAGWWGEGEI
jgi:hypothetical protein